MSLATRNKNCNYCSVISTSIVFDVHYFIENVKYLHSDHDPVVINREI